MPENNGDLNALRSWIRCKYVDKLWFVDNSTASPAVPAPGEIQTAPPGRRKIIHDDPQKKEEGDLFGGWDAFGSSAPAQPTMVTMPPQHTSFEADFASLDRDVTAVSNQQQQQPVQFQANFDQQQDVFQGNNFSQSQLQNMFQANFEQSGASAVPPQQQSSFQTNSDQGGATNASHQQQLSFQADFDQGGAFNASQQQPMFHANFDQAASNVQNQQQSMFTANFYQANQVNSQQQQQLSFQSNFDQNQPKQDMFRANFDQSSMATMQVQGMNNYGNLDQSDANQASLQISNFGKFDQSAAGQQHGALSFGQLQLQQQPDFHTNSMPGGETLNQQTEGFADNSNNALDANNQCDQQTAMNTNAFQSLNDEKKNAFDAFDGLSLEPTTAGLMKSSGTEVDAAPSRSSPANHSSVEGKVHVRDDAEKLVKMQETAMMLRNLSLEQLILVQQFIARLESLNASASNDVEFDNAATMTGVMGSNKHQLGMHMGLGTNTPTPNPDISIANGRAVDFVNHQQVGAGSTIQSNLNSALNAPNLDMPKMNEGAMNFNCYQPTQQLQQPLVSVVGQMQNMQMMTGLGASIPNDTPEPSTANNPLPPVEKEGNPFDMY
jgi:hypothetical protein